MIERMLRLTARLTRVALPVIAPVIALVIALVACDGPTERPSLPAAATAPPKASTTAGEAQRESQHQAEPSSIELAGIHALVKRTGGAAEHAELPLIVAIHGLGDRAERFALLATYPAPARVLLPRGLSEDGSVYSWFPSRVGVCDFDEAELSQGIRASADQLAKFIAAAASRFPTRGRPIVTGFSQGGMLSFTLAAHHPDTISAAIPVAGWLPAPLLQGAGNTAEGGDGKLPPIVALHGDADPLLRVEPTRDSVRGLRQAGYDVRLVEYPGVKHSVSPAMLRELHSTLAQLP